MTHTIHETGISIFTNIHLVVFHGKCNVGKHTIHGCYGL